MNEPIVIKTEWTHEFTPQGTIMWTSPMYPWAIYATPFWETADGIAVEITHDHDSGEVFSAVYPCELNFRDWDKVPFITNDEEVRAMADYVGTMRALLPTILLD